MKLKPEAKFVMIYAEEGWTTNMPLEDFLADDALFAYKHDGRQLAPEHGFPLRLVIPRLYAWKSAKWVRGVELMEKDRAGFSRDGRLPHAWGPLEGRAIPLVLRVYLSLLS